MSLFFSEGFDFLTTRGRSSIVRGSVVRAVLLSALALAMLGGVSALRAASPPEDNGEESEQGESAGEATAGRTGNSPMRAYRVGEEMTVGECLRVTVLGFTDRSGTLEPADWATLRVHNACDEPVRHVKLDLLVLDVLGRVYGTSVWVLSRGEVLRPGGTKTDRYTIPDPADHSPMQWAVRIRTMERPSDRVRRQSAAQAAAAARREAHRRAREATARRLQQQARSFAPSRKRSRSASQSTERTTRGWWY